MPIGMLHRTVLEFVLRLRQGNVTYYEHMNFDQAGCFFLDKIVDQRSK